MSRGEINLPELLRRDAIVMCRELGEKHRFSPWQEAPVEIYMIVNREIAVNIGGMSGSQAFEHEVFIPIDPVFGRTKINKGKDQVSFPNRRGEKPQNFTVTDVLGIQDDGMWHLRVG